MPDIAIMHVNIHTNKSALIKVSFTTASMLDVFTGHSYIDTIAFMTYHNQYIYIFNDIAFTIVMGTVIKYRM